MNKIKGICVIGLGKLGLCTATCFASKGYKVMGVDVDIEKIEKINKGVTPIPETGLANLLKKYKNNIRATNDYDEAILNSDVSFIVVATPSLADGSFSNEFLEKALHRIGESLRRIKSYHVVVITSTVMPQTTEKVARFLLERVSGKKCGRDFGLCYNPEFIALGSVIHDFLNPDFLLIGEMNKKDGDILQGIYTRVCESNPRFARMSPVNAEITKISLNCYITTKITFANSVATLCEKVEGADAFTVCQALGFDSRIGSKYIKPGLGYGGPCFPRDNVAFAGFARILESKAKLAEMVDEVNQDQVERILHKLNSLAAVSNKNKDKINIGVLGLSYKPNTPVIEDSQALNIAQMLANEGYKVKVYDPQAMENARGVLGNKVAYAKSAQDCLLSADFGLVAVAWKEFEKINFTKINKKIIILDCWRLIKPVKGLRLHYLGVGYEVKSEKRKA